MRRHLAIVCALFVSSVVVLAPWPAGAQTSPFHLLGEFQLPRSEIEGTTVGGLSGLAYDARRGVFYAVADDRGDFGSPRFYTLRIDITPAGIRDVRVVGLTYLDSDADAPGIQVYDRNETDFEEILLLPNDELIISSERDSANRPWIRRFALDGTLLGELELPETFVVQSQPNAAGMNVQTRGVRSNLGFEGMAYAPDEMALYAANEQSLAQDGPIATTTAGTNVRLLRASLAAGAPRVTGENVYPSGPIFSAPSPADGAADNGVSGMLWIRHLLPAYDLLVMERAFALGVGNDVNLYGVRLAGAADVSGVPALPTPYTGTSVSRTLLMNVTQAGSTPDNLEGIVLGPRLPNGRASLILMSDDNFSTADPPQINQFLLYEIAADPGK